MGMRRSITIRCQVPGVRSNRWDLREEKMKMEQQQPTHVGGTHDARPHQEGERDAGGG